MQLNLLQKSFIVFSTWRLSLLPYKIKVFLFQLVIGLFLTNNGYKAKILISLEYDNIWNFYDKNRKTVPAYKDDFATDISLENLKILDLSQNEIFCKKIEENDFLIQFIKKYTNLEILKLKNSYFYPNWIANVSPDYNKDPKFSRLYLGLLNYLKSGNREFRFITEIDNHFYLEEKYRKIFDFK